MKEDDVMMKEQTPEELATWVFVRTVSGIAVVVAACVIVLVMGA